MADIPERIVRRFAEKQGIEMTEAFLTFRDLESFLDAAAASSLSPSHRIDEAWHEFILHTKDYATFCDGRYGKMIHHVPAPFNCESEPDKRQCGSGVEESLADCSKCSSDCKSVEAENA